MDSIFLSVKELAARLGVSEKTIYRMINDNKIPYSVKIGGQWRFNSEKIEKWLTQEKKFDRNIKDINKEITLLKAFNEYGEIVEVDGKDRDDMLDRALMKIEKLSPEDIVKIKKNLLYKESIISSSINEIAFMIADYDESVKIDHSLFLIIYLKKPTDFKGLDDKNTRSVMMIIPASKTEQLILNTRLRGIFMDRNFSDSIKNQDEKELIVYLLKSFEEGMNCAN